MENVKDFKLLRNLEDYLIEEHEYYEANSILHRQLLASGLFNHIFVFEYSHHTFNVESENYVTDEYFYLTIFNTAYQIVNKINKEKVPSTKLSDYIQEASNNFSKLDAYTRVDDATFLCAYHVMSIVYSIIYLYADTNKRKISDFISAMTCFPFYSPIDNNSFQDVLNTYINLTRDNCDMVKIKNERIDVTTVEKSNITILSTLNTSTEEQEKHEESDTVIFERKDNLGKIITKRITAREIANIANGTGFITSTKRKQIFAEMFCKITGIAESTILSHLRVKREND